MGDWSLGQVGKVVSGDSQYRTTVTSHSSAHTKGSWTQLLSSLPFSADGLLITIYGSTATAGREYLIDIGIGPTDNEIVLIPNLPWSMNSTMRLKTWQAYFPLSVPVGTRISARVQCSTGDSAIYVQVHVFSGTFGISRSLSYMESYGVNTGTTRGVSIDPGSSGNTKGNWTQITSSLSRETKGLYIGIGEQNNTARTWAAWALDIGVGAQYSESVLIPSLLVYGGGDSSQNVICPSIAGPFLLTIPAATRLSARLACSITDATDRTLDVMLYGLS